MYWINIDWVVWRVYHQWTFILCSWLVNSDLHFTVAIGASYMSAPEAVASTVRGGRGGTPLPGAQHGEAAGWAERTHDNQHEACCIWAGQHQVDSRNLRKADGWRRGRHRTVGKDAWLRPRPHWFERLRRTGCQARVSRHAPSLQPASLRCSCTHLTYIHMVAHTHKHTCMHFYMCCMLKADTGKVNCVSALRNSTALKKIEAQVSFLT